MYTLFRILLSLVCFTALPFITVGQQTGVAKQNTSIILQHIPLEGMAHEVPEKIHQQFQQNPFGLPAAKNKQMMNLFEQAYQKQALYEDAKKAFRTYYNNAYADSVVQWMEMAKSQKVFNKRQEFYTLQGQRKRIVNKYELEQSPPAQPRKIIISKLAKHTSAADFKIESNIKNFRSLVTGYNILSKQQTLDAAQIEEMVGNFRNRVSKQIDQQVQNQLLIMYYDIDNSTLQKYTELYQTPSGKWLKDAITKSIYRAYELAEERFLSSIKSI